jgi:HNH endonuclease
MSEDIPTLVRGLVQKRACGRCEYCWFHEEDAWEPHQPDHIIARKHRGQTVDENLAWTCALCNRYKGSDVASIDPLTDRVVRLFHPRRDRWTRHFGFEDGRIIPRTAVGRVTDFLLQLNRPDRVRVRHILSQKGFYPR